MNLSFGPGDARFRKTFSACSLHAERRRNPEAATDCAKETRLMRRRTRGKEVENVIDRESARLDGLPEATLAQRVQKIAADRGRWSVKRLNGNWALFDENGLTDFEDSSLGSVAFLLGLYMDLNESPDTVVERFYGDLFER